MKRFTALMISATALLYPAQAQTTPTKSNIACVENGHERQVLDVYVPPEADNLPVVFWITAAAGRSATRAT